MTVSSPQTLPGVNVLLEGAAGTGKTYSLSTLVNAGYEVFVLFLEPGVEALLAPWADFGKPVPDNLHWHIMPPQATAFADLRKMILESGSFTQKMLSNAVDPLRGQNNPILPVVDLINDFKCQRTGKSFGPVASWDAKRVFVIDHLTALSGMFLRMLTGNKPVSDKPDYSIAQTNFMNFQSFLINAPCHFVMIAHIDRYIDEIQGGMRLMTKSIGRAIAGDVPIPYSDVILARREGDKFFWDTAESQADLKSRNLSINSKLPPDFAQIMRKWEARRDSAKG